MIKDLYDAILGEVEKTVSCYEGTDELRDAVTAAYMDLVRGHTDHMLWMFESAIWSLSGQYLAESDAGDPDYDRRLVHNNAENHHK